MQRNMSEIENLVFQGGGVRGIAYLGALQTLCDEKNRLESVYLKLKE